MKNNPFEISTSSIYGISSTISQKDLSERRFDASGGLDSRSVVISHTQQAHVFKHDSSATPSRVVGAFSDLKSQKTPSVYNEDANNHNRNQVSRLEANKHDGGGGIDYRKQYEKLREKYKKKEEKYKRDLLEYKNQVIIKNSIIDGFTAEIQSIKLSVSRVSEGEAPTGHHDLASTTYGSEITVRKRIEPDPLQQENAVLKGQLRSGEEALGRLQKEYKELERRHRTLQDEVLNNKRIISDLEFKSRAISPAMSAVGSKEKEYMHKLIECEGALKNREARLQQMDRVEAQLRKQAQDMRNELQSYRSKLAQKEREHIEAVRLLNQKRMVEGDGARRINQLENDLKNQQIQLKFGEDVRNQMNQKIEEQSRKINDLILLEGNYRALQNRSGELERKISSLENELKTHLRTISLMAGQLQESESKDRRIKQLEAEIVAAKHEKEVEIKKKEEKIMEIMKMKDASTEDSLKQYNIISQEYLNCLHQTETLKKKIGDYQRALQGKNHTIDLLEKETATLREEVKAAKATTAAIDSKYREEKSQLLASINQLRKDCCSLQQLSRARESELNQSTQLVKSKDKEVKDLNERIRALEESKEAELRSSHSRYSKQVSALTTDVSNLRQEVAASTINKNMLEKTLSEKEAKMSSMQTEFQRLSTQHRILGQSYLKEKDKALKNQNSLEKELMQLKDSEIKAMTRVKETSDVLEETRRKLSETQAQVRLNQENWNKQRQSLAEQLYRKQEQLKQETGRYRDELGKKQLEILRLERELNGRQEAVRLQEKDNERLKNELSREKEKLNLFVNSLNKEKEAQQLRISQLQQEVQRYREENTKISLGIQHWERELAIKEEEWTQRGQSFNKMLEAKEAEVVAVREEGSRKYQLLSEQYFKLSDSNKAQLKKLKEAEDLTAIANSKIVGLESELAKSKVSLQTSMSSYNEAVSRHSSEREQFMVKVSTLLQEKTKLEQVEHQLREENSELKNTVQVLRIKENQGTTMEAKLGEITALLDEKVVELKKTNDVLAAIKDKNKLVESQFIDQLRKIEELSKNKTTLEETVKEMTATRDKQIEETKNLKNLIELKNKTISSSEEKLKEALTFKTKFEGRDKEAEGLEAGLTQAKQELESLRNDLSAKCKQVFDLASEQRKLNNDFQVEKKNREALEMTMKNMEKQLESRLNQIAQSQRTFAELRMNIRNLEESKKQLEEENRGLSKQSEDLLYKSRGEQMSKQEQENRLKEQITQLNNQLHEASQEHQILAQRLRVAQQQKAQKVRAIQDLTKEVSALASKSELLTEAYNQILKEKLARNKEVDVLNKKVEILEKEAAEKNTQLASALKEKELLKNQYTSKMQTAEQKSRMDIQSLENRLAEREKLMTAEVSKRTEFESNMYTTQQAVRTLEEDRKSNLKKLDNAEKALQIATASYQAKLKTRGEELETLSATLRQTELKLNNALVEAESLKADQAQKQREYNILQSKYEGLERRLDSSSEQAEAQKAADAKMEAEMLRLGQEVRDMEAKLIESAATVSNLNAQISDKEKKVHQLSLTKLELEEKVKSFESKLVNEETLHEQQIAHARQVQLKLEEKLFGAQKEVDTLTANCNILISESGQLKKKIVDLQDTLQLNEKIRSRRESSEVCQTEELATAMINLAMLQAEIDAHENEKKELLEKLKMYEEKNQEMTTSMDYSLEQLKSEHKILKGELAEVNKKLLEGESALLKATQDAESQKRLHDKEKETLEEQLGKIKKELSEIEEKKHELELSLSQAREELIQKEEEKSKLAHELETLQIKPVTIDKEIAAELPSQAQEKFSEFLNKVKPWTEEQVDSETLKKTVEEYTKLTLKVSIPVVTEAELADDTEAQSVCSNLVKEILTETFHRMEIQRLNQKYEHIMGCLKIDVALSEVEQFQKLRIILHAHSIYEKSVNDLMEKIQWMEQNLNLLNQENNEFHAELENKELAIFELKKIISMHEQNIIGMRSYEHTLTKKLASLEELVGILNQSIISKEIQLFNLRMELQDNPEDDEEVLVEEKTEKSESSPLRAAVKSDKSPVPSKNKSESPGKSPSKSGQNESPSPFEKQSESGEGVQQQGQATQIQAIEEKAQKIQQAVEEKVIQGKQEEVGAGVIQEHLDKPAENDEDSPPSQSPANQQ